MAQKPSKKKAKKQDKRDAKRSAAKIAKKKDQPKKAGRKGKKAADVAPEQVSETQDEKRVQAPVTVTVETSPEPEPADVAESDGAELREAWQFEVADPQYGLRPRALIARLESDLATHMERAKPARYLHSLSVAHVAEQMALQYGVDPLQARVAGILHDWDKVLTNAEQIELASRLGVDLGVDAHLVQPLLHGLTAAKRLPDIYPELPDCIWQAIARHTIGAKDMTPLDMVLFVADGIEPMRADVPAIHHVRQLVSDAAPLEEVFWASFYHGVAYVIDTERYLYPGTLDIYNHIALRRKASNL